LIQKLTKIKFEVVLIKIMMPSIGDKTMQLRGLHVAEQRRCKYKIQ